MIFLGEYLVQCQNSSLKMFVFVSLLFVVNFRVLSVIVFGLEIVFLKMGLVAIDCFCVRVKVVSWSKGWVQHVCVPPLTTLSAQQLRPVAQ